MNNRSLYSYFLLSAALILLAITGGYFVNHTSEHIPTDKIRKNFREAQQQMEKIMLETASFVKKNTNETNNIRYFSRLDKKYSDKLMFFYRFKAGKLQNWSTNELNISSDLLKISNQSVIEYDRNIIQIFKQKISDNFLLGVLVLRRDYYIYNKYLQSYNNLDIPQNIKITLTTEPSEYVIKNISGNPAFSLTSTKKTLRQNTTAENFFFFVFLAGFALLLFSVLRLKNKLLIATVFIVLWVLRLVLLYGKFPDSLYHISLFQPFAYSFNSWMFSLGDALINVVLIFYSILLITKFHLKQVPLFLLPFAIVLLGVGLELIFIFVKSLVFDSSLNFLFFSLTTIDNHFFVLLIILILFFSFYRLAEFFLEAFSISLHKHLFFVSVFLVAVGLFSYHIFRCSHCWLTGLLTGIFFILFMLGHYFLKNRIPLYSYFILNTTFIALLLSLVFFFFTDKKDDATKRLLIVNLASERDFVAESLLSDLGKRIYADTTFVSILFDENTTFNEKNNYLSTKYFQGFWNNFDFQITICTPYDSLNVYEDGNVENCYLFFNKLKNDFGIQLSDTNFYFLDNNNGRNSYLGILTFFRNNRTIKIFMEIDSKLISVKLGYPELLINGKTDKSKLLSDFYYAKYKNGKLIAQLGDIAYPIIDTDYRNAIGNRTFFLLKTKKIKHLIYRKDKDTIIVLSSPRHSFWSFLMEFSYLFLFGIIAIIIIRIFHKKDFKTWLLSINLQRRIQLTIFGILFSFFIVVGSLTVFYIYHHLQKEFQNTMSERIESVCMELNHKIANVPDLSYYETSYLNLLLTKFSSIFLTDIHLFSTEGQLIATSRPQIFEKKIEGKIMNVSALQALKIQKLSKFVHSEQIGKLKFLSAYIPFFNDQNKLIAYLNLPYFTRQSEISQQLSQIIVTIVNVFIVLIVFSFIAVTIIAKQLTKPLTVIREHIRHLQFDGRKNKPIAYKRQDEIGDLISEYNRMVGELEKSAELLAQSEREFAWREMAKQVAHEIKNPLTPMRLSVQHLQKAWKSHKEHLDDFISHTTKNLIEQIDALTVIANEFSHFAKMPRSKKEIFSPIEKLENIVSIFNKSTGYTLLFISTEKTKEIKIEMDKEQFTMVFNNLIKNAIQSIPTTKKGEITVSADVEDNFFMVVVSDNGIGISEENKNRIFSPNFTTKSSGMGIGLSIVKTIITNIGGTIDFESMQEEGTQFYLRFPIK